MQCDTNKPIDDEDEDDENDEDEDGDSWLVSLYWMMIVGAGVDEMNSEQETTMKR